MTTTLSLVQRLMTHRPPLRTLRSKFILGFLIACVIAVGNIAVVKSLLHQSDAIAATVNVAGKMRMLGQRIGFMLLATQDLDGHTDQAGNYNKADLHHYKSSFEHALNVLRTGGYAFDHDVPAVSNGMHAHLDNIETAWKNYLEALDALDALDAAPSITSDSLNATTHINHDGNNYAIMNLIAASEWLLIKTETLIDSLVQQSRNVQTHVMQKTYGLFAINMLMLLVAGGIILCKVLRPIQDLMHLSNELTAGNYAARLNMKSGDEFGALSKTLNNSAFHIEQLLFNMETKQKSLDQLKIKLRRAALVYEHITEAVVITDADGYAQDINPAFSKITGFSPSEVIGKRMNILNSGHHSVYFFQKLWRSVLETGYWSGDIRNRRKSGDEFVGHLIINTYYNEDGSVNCRIGLFSDVTERRKQEALIWRQSRFDHLTRLPNRQMFEENLQLSIRQSQRSGLPFAVLFLDLDWFKEINDTFGHDEGDLLLQQVARRLSNCCRTSDQVARLGGDEFVMVIQDLERHEDIEPICEKVLKTISEPYALGVGDVRISCSLGLAFYPSDTDDATQLLKYADLAMYAAKNRGRNQYCRFSASMHQAMEQRSSLLTDLQTAVDASQFVLHYQPIVNLQSGRVSNAEALVRWNHPTRGLIGPLDFIPLAEDSGMIVQIGESVFQQATQQLASWRQSLDNSFMVSVNVSPTQFESRSLEPQAWAQELKKMDLPGCSLALEITEGLLMKNRTVALDKLQAFRRHGIRIALDDFGTGYSSVSYLKHFNIDVIKIDRSFVCNLTENSENMVLCEAIITMSHQLGMKVIAEGIETQQQHELLRTAGCDYGQGYWYSKPMQASQFTEWTHAWNADITA